MSEYLIKTQIKVGENASGKAIEVTKFHIKGRDHKAKTVYIQASMHASEIQGNAVILALLDCFAQNQPLGDVVVIPQCNPIGQDMLIGSGHQGRFDAVNGDNWNRYYYKPEIEYKQFAETHLKSSSDIYKQALRKMISAQIDQLLINDYGLSRAKRLNYIMQQQALVADVILDLHTDTYAIDYLYSPQYAKKSAENFGFEHVLLIENKCNGALDEAGFYPWWSLQKAFAELGRKEPVLVESFTLELGSEERIDSQKAKVQAHRIMHYLASQKVVNFEPKHKQFLSKHIVFHQEDSFRSVYANEGGLYEWFLSPGDIFEKGEVIGKCLQMSKPRALEICYPFSGLIMSINAQGSVQQGSHLLNVVVDVSDDKPVPKLGKLF